MGATTRVVDKGKKIFIGEKSGSLISFFGVTAVAQQANSAVLTGTLTGTADGALADVSGTGNDTQVNKNFLEIQTTLTEIQTILSNLGLMASE